MNPAQIDCEEPIVTKLVADADTSKARNPARVINSFVHFKEKILDHNTDEFKVKHENQLTNKASG